MSKIVIWGYKPFSHTHSYIHWGFHRAAQYLGHKVYWFDDKDDVSGFDFSDSIFLTECNASVGMPIRKDCKYVLHNTPHYPGMGKVLNIQYMTYEAYGYEQVGDGITYIDGCLFFPWGSPLLPYEFDEADIYAKRGDFIAFIGTFNGPNVGGNHENVMRVVDAANKDGRIMVAGGGYTGKVQNPQIHYVDNWVSVDDEAALLRSAYMAPAIQGDNQLGNGMIPCRLFKSISYGNDGLTNNKLAYEYFNGEILYHEDPYVLYDMAKAQRNTDRILRLMKFVKKK